MNVQNTPNMDPNHENTWACFHSIHLWTIKHKNMDLKVWEHVKTDIKAQSYNFKHKLWNKNHGRLLKWNIDARNYNFGFFFLSENYNFEVTLERYMFNLITCFHCRCLETPFFMYFIAQKKKTAKNRRIEENWKKNRKNSCWSKKIEESLSFKGERIMQGFFGREECFDAGRVGSLSWGWD